MTRITSFLIFARQDEQFPFSPTVEFHLNNNELIHKNKEEKILQFHYLKKITYAHDVTMRAQVYVVGGGFQGDTAVPSNTSSQSKGLTIKTSGSHSRHSDHYFVI
jgi:hypothetical protein